MFEGQRPDVVAFRCKEFDVPQSLAQVWLHVVFSTKNRAPFLKDAEFRDQMLRMLAYHTKESGCVVAKVGGHIDHVHLLIGLSRTLPISKLIEVVKSQTSKWAKTASGGSNRFAWQHGYGVFSVSHSNLGDVEHYIDNQETHHARRDYQEEFRLLCTKHGIEINEQYVWD
jgi:REP element-mobilizing transposase RayT